jgi:hypothetical protein
MLSHATAARDVLADRRRTGQPQSTASLERELAQAQAMCKRQERAIEALSTAVGALRRGAAALTDENRELRAEIAGMPRARRASQRSREGCSGGGGAEWARRHGDRVRPGGRRGPRETCGQPASRIPVTRPPRPQAFRVSVRGIRCDGGRSPRRRQEHR